MRDDMLQIELFFFRKGKAGKLNKECTIEEQAELLPYDHSYEVKRENITLGKQLGAGAFGRVLLGQVKGLNGNESPTRVAVKMCKFGYDMAQLRALIMELKIIIHLGKHLNIVNLLGAQTLNIDKGELWILVEYCKYGNLLKFIQRAKAQFINQIDPVSSEIDVERTSPFPNDPLSPTSLGMAVSNELVVFVSVVISVVVFVTAIRVFIEDIFIEGVVVTYAVMTLNRYERTSNSNPDSPLDLHPESSIEIGQSMGRNPSTTSNTRLTTNSIMITI
ncbi:Vascular endothelial growth factor receptor 1 [Armadillidium vulgare]|nr:Vascular endothelial growth factor receptor 1 [Armadillidium vulgare]